MSRICPCGSEKNYSECCEPYLIGTQLPKTAEALMRARYSAYAVSDIDYLYKTSGEAVKREFDAKSSKTWSESADWTGLEVVTTEGGTDHDTKGVVEFIAHYTVKDTPFDHHERAEFEKVDGEWVFIDGQIITPGPVRREQPKVGRNEPCPCGSGKKFKKCCGL